MATMIRQLASVATSALRHPRRSIGQVTGLARGAVVGVAHLVARDQRHQPDGAADRVAPTPEPPAEPQASAPPPAPAVPGEEWDEAAQAQEPDRDVPTPAGTTGADEAYDPDAGRTDLDQPGTEPLLDPSTAKSVRSESETLRRASDPDKG